MAVVKPIVLVGGELQELGSGDVVYFPTQTANRIFAGPVGGGAAIPTFRSLVAADLGSGTANSTTFLRGDQTWAVVAPAGSNTQIQYNNAGVFGASANLTYDGTTLASLSSGTQLKLIYAPTPAYQTHFTMSSSGLEINSQGAAVTIDSGGGNRFTVNTTGDSFTFRIPVAPYLGLYGASSRLGWFGFGFGTTNFEFSNENSGSLKFRTGSNSVRMEIAATGETIFTGDVSMNSTYPAFRTLSLQHTNSGGGVSLTNLDNGANIVLKASAGNKLDISGGFQSSGTNVFSQIQPYAGGGILALSPSQWALNSKFIADATGTGTTATAQLQARSITEQLRLEYDASNYTKFTVGPTGILTIDNVGSVAKTVFSDPVHGVINQYASGWSTSGKFVTEDAIWNLQPAKNNVAFASPGTSDDVTQGYYYNSLWTDLLGAPDVYVCKDPATASAVWIKFA